MTIRQHYYTSCRNPETAKTGFQVKAATPGIPRRAEQTLQKLISYRPPGNADPQAIDAHPISLRFYVPAPQEALLICAQSNGPDEFGRPGNFFAHTLVGPVDSFTEPLPPIFYWHSPFWVRTDDTPATSLPELNTLADAARVTFNYDAIWPFLTPQRQAWFYQMLCAVLDYPQSKRRIIIVDSGENTALWIALLTMALPHQHRALLTFATYHHDPYTVPFLVTGTTLDSSFRFMADEYESYFILNTVEGRASTAPPSDFARYVVDHFTPDQYEKTVLDLFMLLKRRAPGTTPDPAQLTALTRFYMLQAGQGILLSSDQIASTTHAVIADITGSNKPDGADMQDLRTAWDLIASDLLATHQTAHLPDFMAALERLSKIDPDFGATCPKACAVFGQLVLDGQLEQAKALQTLLSATYPGDTLRASLSQSDTLGNMVQQLRENDVAQLRAFWEYCGPLLDTDVPATTTALLPVYHRTLETAEHAARDGGYDPLTVPREIHGLLTAWLRPHKTINTITDLVQQFHQQHPGSPVFGWVYYAWVGHAPLEQRVKMREIYGRTDPTIITHELQRDLLRYRNSPVELASLVDTWVAHLPALHREAIALDAVRFLWGRDDVSRSGFASELLKHGGVVRLLDDGWQVQLLEASSQMLRFTTPDPDTLALYRRVLATDDFALSPDVRAKLQGVVSLATGELHEGIIPSLNESFRSMTAEAYRPAITEFVEKFFAATEPPNAHGVLVAAAYVPAQRVAFWQVYWATLTHTLLHDGNLAAVVRALDFWFMDGHYLHRTHPLQLADFFLNLPAALDQLQSEKGYAKTGRAFEALVRERPWAALLPQHFSEGQKSRGFLKGLFER